MDSQNFLALNVQNSPGVYTILPRPIPGGGRRRDRHVRQRAELRPLGAGHDRQLLHRRQRRGAEYEPFCRNGSWVSDQYNGATLDMVVADSCDDGNAWCKDDPYHVDLAQASLNQFVLNGQPVGNMYPDHWNNRQVTWQFIPAPNYTGDINIGAIQGAQPYWPAIAISHLPNGIHGVQYLRERHMDQRHDGQRHGRRLYRRADDGIWDGGILLRDPGHRRVGEPDQRRAGTTSACRRAAERVLSPLHADQLHDVHRAHVAVAVDVFGLGGCTLTSSVTNSWPGGYQLQLTVTNSGTTPLTGWTAGFMFADTSETITSSWNATVSQSGQQVSAVNASYDGSVAAGESTTFGVVGQRIQLCPVRPELRRALTEPGRYINRATRSLSRRERGSPYPASVHGQGGPSVTRRSSGAPGARPGRSVPCWPGSSPRSGPSHRSTTSTGTARGHLRDQAARAPGNVLLNRSGTEPVSPERRWRMHRTDLHGPMSR